jgi:hypothetical protein
VRSSDRLVRHGELLPASFLWDWERKRRRWWMKMNAMPWRHMTFWPCKSRSNPLLIIIVVIIKAAEQGVKFPADDRRVVMDRSGREGVILVAPAE